MTEFSAYFVARWKDGQMPKAKPGNTVVSYDQTNTAYDIVDDDAADFLEWVAQVWELDRDPRGIWDDATEIMTDEPAADYLDRIGVSVRVA